MSVSIRARVGWIVFFVGVVLIGVGAWRGLGPLSYLWPGERSLSSVSGFSRHAWRQNGKTLVLALSADCQECLQSSGFYRDLAKAAPGKFDLIATFDGDVEQGRRRLNALDISVQDVFTISRGALGIDATPSVLLVDDRGLVTRRWTGLLDSLQRDEVAEAVGIELPGVAAVAPSPRLQPPLIAAATGSTGEVAGRGGIRPAPRPAPEKPSVAQLIAAFTHPEESVIIDVRPRELFQQLRIDGSVSIPRDELVIRLLHEVDLKKSLFVFCDFCAECEKVTPSIAQRDLCRRSLDQFTSLGAVPATIIDASLIELKAAGIRLASGPPE